MHPGTGLSRTRFLRYYNGISGPKGNKNRYDEVWGDHTSITLAAVQSNEIYKSLPLKTETIKK